MYKINGGSRREMASVREGSGGIGTSNNAMTIVFRRITFRDAFIYSLKKNKKKNREIPRNNGRASRARTSANMGVHTSNGTFQSFLVLLPIGIANMVEFPTSFRHTQILIVSLTNTNSKNLFFDINFSAVWSVCSALSKSIVIFSSLGYNYHHY